MGLTYLRNLGVTPFDKTLFRRLLTPSWAGMVAYVFTSVITLGILLAITHYDSGAFDRYIDTWRMALERTAAAQPYDAYAGEPTMLEQAISTSFSVMVWAGVGSLLFFFAASLLESLRSKGHVHVHHAQIIGVAFMHLVVRSLALCLLLLGLWVFIKFVILYAFGAAYVAGVTASGWNGTGFIVLAMLLLIGGLHMMVVLLRLFLLRPRLFHGTVYQ